MQRILLTLTIFLCIRCTLAQDVSFPAQVKDSIDITVQFKESAVYLLCRGTRSKVGTIAKFFNWNDTASTHVGIGCIVSGKLKIYNVTTGSTTANAFRVETLEEFLNHDDLYSFQLWQIKLNKEERKKVYRCCLQFCHKTVNFDYRFKISDDEALYCSEFCVNLLHSIDPVKFNFSPRTKDISNTIFESLLNRKELVYYPVDFFQSNAYFTLLKSYLIKK